MAVPCSIPSGKCLTEEMILQKACVKSLEKVRTVNLWRQDLENIWIVRRLQCVESISLVSNRISELQPFAACHHLQELYLRNNLISSLDELKALRGLAKLRILWLMDNPCASLPHYRAFAIYCCPGLSNLDGVGVTTLEREMACRQMTQEFVKELLTKREVAGPDCTITVPRSASPLLDFPTAPPPSIRAGRGGVSTSLSSTVAFKKKEPRSVSAHPGGSHDVSPRGRAVKQPPSVPSSPTSAPPRQSECSSSPTSSSATSTSSSSLPCGSRLRRMLLPLSSSPSKSDVCVEEKVCGTVRKEPGRDTTTSTTTANTAGAAAVLLPCGSTPPTSASGSSDAALNEKQEKEVSSDNRRTVNKHTSSNGCIAHKTPKSENNCDKNAQPAFHSGEQQVLLSSIHTLLPLLSKESLLVVQSKVKEFLKVMNDGGEENGT